MLPAPDPQTGPRFAPEVESLIRSEQERGYRNLALKLGMGADPQKAYERLSGKPVSQPFDGKYEDPAGRQIMALLLRWAAKAMADVGTMALDPLPAIATLPNGNISAQVTIEPKTEVPILFFEQGLFHYLYDFCHLIGWAVPPLSPTMLSDDKALLNLVHRYTMPFQSSFSFVDTLGSYTFEGSPMVKGVRVPRPEHNMPLCMALLTLMERFVMVHELTHIQLGHLTNAPGREEEFEADAASMVLVTYMTGLDGVAWGFGYWACELTLQALHLLYAAISLAEFGNRKISWIDHSHPEPLVRQRELRQIWLDPRVPPSRLGAARELCGMSDSLVQKLWEFAWAALSLSHQDGARPSPMWRGLIDATFAARP